MKKFLMEGIGTFVLVLFIILIQNNNAGTLPALAYGAVLVALTYAGGALSGAHYNPAISTAVLIQGKLERWDMPYYIIAQLAGALLAAFFAAFMLRCTGNPEIVLQQYEPFCAIFAEAVGAFFLTLVFLGTSISFGNTENQYRGLAIGFAAAGGAYALSGICSATFNPVIVLGMAITGACGWNELWISLGGTLIGAAAGASIVKALFETPNE